MSKDYKSDEDIIDEMIKTPEAFVDFDRTWNGKYDFVRCGDCNGPMLGHRAEKCRKNDGYEDALVRSSINVRTTLNKYMDTKRKEEMDYKQNREVQLAKDLPAKTSLMIGRIEIPN